MVAPEYSSSDHAHVSANFLRNWQAGRVCVHPTDTIPGLTCNPADTRAIQRLEQLKKRTQQKALLGLVADFSTAQRFWQTLPALWEELIPLLWPAPLTCVWKSRASVPPCLVSERGELALRQPLLARDDRWLLTVLQKLSYPLPSTSINYEGEAPLSGEHDLAQFCAKHAVFLPPISWEAKNTAPSSVLRIIDEKNFEWLRVGALSEEKFQAIYLRIRAKHKREFSLYLASQSPRRRDLLTGAGIAFTVVESAYVEETLRGTIADPREYVCMHAINKGLWVVESPAFQASVSGPSIVLSADTIVVLGETILEKPRSAAEAIAMLMSLSGKTHEVLTSLCFHFYEPHLRQHRTLEETFSTRVSFRPLSVEEIHSYVASGEPMDKAGSYALQGRGASFVKSVHGSNTSVIGLPLAETVEGLAKAHLIFEAMA